MNDTQPGRSAIAPIVFFGLTMTVAVVMLLWALVLWLASLTGSMIWGTLIVGGFFALIATILYFASVRKTVRYIREQAETITEMARIVKTGYDWFTEKINDTMNRLLDHLLRKL